MRIELLQFRESCAQAITELTQMEERSRLEKERAATKLSDSEDSEEPEPDEMTDQIICLARVRARVLELLTDSVLHYTHTIYMENQTALDYKALCAAFEGLKCKELIQQAEEKFPRLKAVCESRRNGVGIENQVTLLPGGTSMKGPANNRQRAKAGPQRKRGNHKRKKKR